MAIEDLGFWPVELASLYVCTSCYEKVFWNKIPNPSCECGAFSAYEAFNIQDINEWGSPLLIEEAEKALAKAAAPQIHSSIPIV